MKSIQQQVISPKPINLLKTPDLLYRKASYILEKLSPEEESVIATEEVYTFFYIRDILAKIGNPVFELGEAVLAKVTTFVELYLDLISNSEQADQFYSTFERLQNHNPELVLKFIDYELKSLDLNYLMEKNIPFIIPVKEYANGNSGRFSNESITIPVDSTERLIALEKAALKNPALKEKLERYLANDQSLEP